MSSGKAKRVSKEQLTQNDIKAFKSALVKHGDSDCIVLKNIPGRCSDTYFKCDDGTMISPKRLAYAIHFGECKEGFALYRNRQCDTYLCVNPRHYDLVDQKSGYKYSNCTGQDNEVDNDKFEYKPLSAPNVKDYIAKQHDKLDERIKTLTDGCESPIEELLAIALSKRLPDDEIEKQKEFTFGDKTYRVDFCITRTWQAPSTFAAPYSNMNVISKVVVECDGFGYHYATQEQVERDHERDRAFMECWIPVVRFTGSEINKYPDDCASEIEKLLSEQINHDLFAVADYIRAYKESKDEVHD